jgi:beta-hydroxylase
MPANFLTKSAYRATSWLGEGLIRLVERLIFNSKDPAFYSTDQFYWVKKMEADYPKIKAELLRVMQDYPSIPELKKLSEEQQRIVKGNQWKSFFFYAYGRDIEKNCMRCPDTSKALQQIPGMLSAFFSILEPGTSLLPHRGLYKGVLRYHLALSVPKEYDKCALKVGEQIVHWQEGSSIIFDDTFEHEAWNKSEEIRVLLFVDFERPLSFPANLTNKGILWLFSRSPFIQRILDRV